MRKVTAIFLLISAFIFHGCYYDKEETLYPNGLTCHNLNARYSVNVKPIIEANCAFPGCHGDGSTNGPGPLLTYEQIKKAAPEIKAAVLTKLMPKGFAMSNLDIKTISCWVDAGAPEN